MLLSISLGKPERADFYDDMDIIGAANASPAVVVEPIWVLNLFLFYNSLWKLPRVPGVLRRYPLGNRIVSQFPEIGKEYPDGDGCK